MPEIKDKLLEEKDGLSTKIDGILPFEVPTRFVDIPKNVVHIVSTYMRVVWDIKNSGKKIDIEQVIDNSKAMFSAGARWNDKLWMQHCAASIREIICFIEPHDFHKALKCIPLRTNPKADPRIIDDFDVLMNIKAYLSDVVHFVPDPRLGWISKIYPTEGFGNMNKEDFIKEESDVFERVCIELIYKLYRIFTDYCLGDEN